MFKSGREITNIKWNYEIFDGPIKNFAEIVLYKCQEKLQSKKYHSFFIVIAELLLIYSFSF
jgi:hypothetical protein